MDTLGSVISLDGAYDSKKNRKMLFNAGMMPNINENKRNRKSKKRGRKRLFDIGYIQRAVQNNRESVLLGGQIQAAIAEVRAPQHSSLRDEAHGLYDD